MIKRYHEAPITIFNKVQKLTDGDYALVHLFESNPKYLRMFEKAVEAGRDVILDNSIFELGEAFDSDRFAYWVKHLKPTWYIVPDSWKNSKQTIRMFQKFIMEHPDLPGKRVGVAQGVTVEDVIETYKAIEPYCDMIAFNLDFASESGLPEEGIPYCLRMSVGRFKVLSALNDSGVLNKDKPHHLLGCGVPQEVIWYPRTWKWIRSIDTCNPVIHGMLWYPYDEAIPGIVFKASAKMCNCIDDIVPESMWRYIERNIHMMEDFCSDYR